MSRASASLFFKITMKGNLVDFEDVPKAARFAAGAGKFGGPRYKRSGMVTGITRTTRALLRC